MQDISALVEPEPDAQPCVQSSSENLEASINHQQCHNVFLLPRLLCLKLLKLAFLLLPCYLLFLALQSSYFQQYLGVLSDSALLSKIVPIDLGMAFDLALAQNLIFPFVVGLLLLARRAGFPLPTTVLWLAVLCASWSAWITYSYHGSRESNYLIARLTGDEFETTSRLFREEVGGYVRVESNVQGSRYFDSLESEVEAQALLEKMEDASAVVWGSDSWLKISLQEQKPLELQELGYAQLKTPEVKDTEVFHALIKMRLVVAVPLVGFSIYPNDASADFTATLFSGLLPAHLSQGFVESDLSPESEMDLLSAGRIDAPWTTYSHKAFALWSLANLYVREAVEGDILELGKLACAQALYSEAAGMFQEEENPELYSAIFNNHGLVLTISGLFSEDSISQFKSAEAAFERSLGTANHWASKAKKTGRGARKKVGRLQAGKAASKNQARLSTIRSALKAS